jgi:hypothetical protein
MAWPTSGTYLLAQALMFAAIGSAFESWTEDDVAQWLQQINLPKYARCSKANSSGGISSFGSTRRYTDIFVSNNIDGQCLTDITDASLQELGVKSVGHRIKLLKELRKLVGGVCATPAPTFAP